MFINNSYSIRMALDLPYRYGFHHIALAFGNKAIINDVANEKIKIHSDFSFNIKNKIDLKERVSHLLIGLVEIIPLINIIVACVDKYLHKKSIVQPHQKVWHAKLEELRSSYIQAKGQRKEQVKFLAANFLNKATPKHLTSWIKSLKEINPNYTTSEQATPIEEYNYHRECLEQALDHGRQFNKNLAYGESSLFILTDTTEVNHLLSVSCKIIDSKKTIDTYAKSIKDTLKEHFLKYPNAPLDKELDAPVLLDVTHILDQTVITNKDQKLENRFIQCFEKFKEDFKNAQTKAIKQLVAEDNHLLKFESDMQKILDKNIICMSRVKIEGVSGLKLLPIGDYSKKETQFHSPLIRKIIGSGIYIGAINLRRLISDVFQQQPNLEYSIYKTEISHKFYKKKQDFTNKLFFQRLACLFGIQPVLNKTAYGISVNQLQENITKIDTKPHMKVLGKATIDLLQGFFKEIDEKKWSKLQQDPVLYKILQNSLSSIQDHLEIAEKYAIADKFYLFSQEIEIVHAELSILLELTHPFQKKAFQDIYEKELLCKSIPNQMRSMLKAGLGKAAVNIFYGIAAAVKQQNSVLEGVGSLGAYYEQKILMNYYFDDYINDLSLPKINMYHGQFNCNIDVGSDPVEYKRRDIASDVRKLLDEQRVADNFTVAVDLTIDEFYSENVQQLLSQFQKEIKDGKLNFVFFSSGQKFYMLGMDNYYGAPFYLVNNGDKKWEVFDALFTHPSHEVDSLSAQWFCLATKYAADSLSNYKKLIFNNTRDILNKIPSSLQSNFNKNMRVNPVHPDMQPSFIDLKVLKPPKEQEKVSCDIKKIFQKMLIERNMEAYSRGSFGFYLCNFAVFGFLDNKARTIRVNPGINPEDNNKIVDFFKGLSSFSFFEEKQPLIQS